MCLKIGDKDRAHNGRSQDVRGHGTEIVVISGPQNHRQQWTAKALGANVLNELS